MEDLFVGGGCGVIPTQSACNPTLTACFAIVGARKIIEELRRPTESSKRNHGLLQLLGNSAALNVVPLVLKLNKSLHFVASRTTRRS